MIPKSLKELRVGQSGAFEIWATGQGATCDYAGMIFAYGYYVMAGIVAICAIYLIFYHELHKKIRDLLSKCPCSSKSALIEAAIPGQA